jgi:hypothetical protein
MPSRADLLCVPTGIFDRARWVAEHWPELIEDFPLSGQGWSCVSALEEHLFARVVRELDPACPVCGVETEDGSFQRHPEGFRVSYESCGHSVLMSAVELEGRMRARAA